MTTDTEESARIAAGMPVGRLLAGAAALVAWWLAYRSLLPFAQWVTYGPLGLSGGTRLANAVEFFLYDTPLRFAQHDVTQS